MTMAPPIVTGRMCLQGLMRLSLQADSASTATNSLAVMQTIPYAVAARATHQPHEVEAFVGIRVIDS